MPCLTCNEVIPEARFRLGYSLCMRCGEEQARKLKHCIVPMHKSNYIVVSPESAKTLLAQITRPGRGNNH